MTTPETIWANVLKSLRAEKQYALFGLVSSLEDCQISPNGIVLRSHNAAELQILKRHLPRLQQLAGELPVTLEDVAQTNNDQDGAIVAQLKDLFGDKLTLE